MPHIPTPTKSNQINIKQHRNLYNNGNTRAQTIWP